MPNQHCRQSRHKRTQLRDGEPFLQGLDLGPPLVEVTETGAAFVARALTEGFLDLLASEVAAGPLRHYREQFGQVRQQIEGFDAVAPFEGSPGIACLSHAVTTLVRRQGAGIRGLPSWRVNEAGVVLYRPRSIGITPHLDARRYRRLVVVATVRGEAVLTITDGREGDPIAEFRAAPGSLTLLRGPGLAGSRDGRPFHSVGSPMGGERWAIGLRMSTAPRA